MFEKIKKWISEKKNDKWFKVAVIAAILVIAAITTNFINKDEESRGSESSPVTENNGNAETDNESGFHVGIGHIVMLGVFTAAYGIDRIIVYKNKLEDDKKYDIHKEE